MTPLPKPAYGEPCNRCGQCCMKYPCPVARFMFNQETGRCPALEPDGVQFVCGLVANPQKYVPVSALPVDLRSLHKAAKVLIDAGNGCDAQFVGEPINEAYRQSKREEEARRYSPQPASSAFLRALRVWGIIIKRKKENAA